MNCKTFQSQLPELVLNPAAASNSIAQKHMAECQLCERQYASYVATMSIMDAWKAPEPSPYFDQKMAVLLREEMAAPKLNFFARLKEQILLNTGRQFRPAVAVVAVLVLMLGGGSYAGFQKATLNADPSQVSATVNDLQILDKNEQALQQMDQLLQEDDSSDDSTANAPS